MSATEQKLYVCPSCGGINVAVTEETKFMVNTGAHYCHSVKAQDDDAKVNCLDCSWEGHRVSLLHIRTTGATHE